MLGISNFFNWLRSLFWSTTMDVALIGLQNAGKVSSHYPLQCWKPELIRSTSLLSWPHSTLSFSFNISLVQTSLVNVLAKGEFTKEMIPTVCVTWISEEVMPTDLEETAISHSGFNLRKVQKGNVVSLPLPSLPLRQTLRSSSSSADTETLGYVSPFFLSSFPI